jgi:hypothetical protein
VRTHPFRLGLLAGATVVLADQLLLAAPSSAAIAHDQLSAPLGMRMSELQGVSCFLGGALGGATTWAYSGVLTVAAAGATNPLLLVPLVAAGFVSGCDLGAHLGPALVWFSQLW